MAINKYKQAISESTSVLRIKGLIGFVNFLKEEAKMMSDESLPKYKRVYMN
jgi:hypothetical protein